MGVAPKTTCLLCKKSYIRCERERKIKLEAEKAYDRVSWSFLEDTLGAFNFPRNLIRLIMLCVKNAKSQILWNGESLESITHTCGLRHGDPLSPYLFVLCTDRLSYMVNEKVAAKKWCPIKPCRTGPSFSHILFADDLIIMSKATIANARVIKRVIDVFCSHSSLNLNLALQPQLKSGKIESLFLKNWWC